MSALLTASSLQSGYGHIQVLHDISLTINVCSVTAIIGPNGHGKSTLLRTLSGLNKMWSGEIHFNGASVPSSAPDRARAGLILVPQGDQLFMGMTVEENLLMGAFTRTDRDGVSESLHEVYELFPRLAERRLQQTNSLSGGERRMVGIGRGMMAKGKLMMIDEPSLGLAPLIIEQIYDALGQLVSDERAILVVEENPSRVMGIANDFHLIDGGRLTWSGNAKQLQQSDDITKTYLGA